MNANTLKKIKRQLSESENSIRDLPIDLQEAIAENKNIDCLYLADELSKLKDIVEFLLSDDNCYASSVMAEYDNPGKKVWIDKWHNSWVV